MDDMRMLMDALPKPPDFAYDWSALGRSALGRWLDKLAQVRQNPVWHGEGDVLTHTRMVCERLCENPAFRALNAQRRQAIALAALLHDVGKIPATKLEDGQWVSPGHGGVGARMAREILWKHFGMSGTPQAIRMRETVCSLIRHHMLPEHLLDRENPELLLCEIAADAALTELFSVDLLCMLAQADVLGRIADDTAELCQMVELSRQAAQEAGCLHGPIHFLDAYTQRAYFQGRKVWNGQALFNDTWGEVILLSGLPGTGKDTWIARCGGGLPVVSLDALRIQMGVDPTDAQGEVGQAAQEQARVYLRAKQPFIWNATNLTEAMRQKLVGLFEGYGAAVHIVYLETQWEENLRRNAQRSARVPESVIEGMLGKMVLPRRREAQSVEWICV